MTLGLCNAPGIFWRYMSFFSYCITKIMEVFIDDFSVHGNSFDEYLHHLILVLKHCIETNLVLISKVSFHGGAW